jgi:BMFP domain-containing protein YqiC
MIFNTLSSPIAGLNLGTPNLSASNASNSNPALNALGFNTNALALPTPNAGNPLFNLGATQGLLSPQTPSLSNNLLSGFNAVPNTTGSIFANVPGNGALSFANPSTSGTVAPQGGESSALLAGLDQFLKSAELFLKQPSAMAQASSPMGALANLPAVAPVAQTAVAPVAQQSGVVIPPDLLAQLLGSRVANNNSDTEDTSVTQALEAKIEALEAKITETKEMPSTTIAQQLEALKTQLAQIKANTVQAKTTPAQATLQARLKELENQIATLKKPELVAKPPVKAGVTKA